MFFAAKEDDATRALTLGPQMAVAEVGVYRGPHYYSHTPMIRIQLDLGRMDQLVHSRPLMRPLS